MKCERKKFVIDGERFSDIDGFFKEAGHVLSKMGGSFGKNFDAFNDILYGDMGRFDYEENIELTWINFQKSKKEFNPEEIKSLMEILEIHKFHIKFSTVN